ncbi:MAG: hypothetical protein KBA14_06235 [Saprospiraceae bacterium]|nr:hypothetical protein [Saprospiraceae bacterium]
MCFSATASFGASVCLTGLGIASMRMVKSPGQYGFASIPLVFGVQQFAEGVVWLSLEHESMSGWGPMASMAFLIFAQVVWPIWLPASFVMLEEDPKRKKRLKLFLIPGIVVACYFLYLLMTLPLVTEAVNHHVFYRLAFPIPLIPYAAALYLSATLIPPLLSRTYKIQMIGVVLFVSYVIARLFFQPSLISVWCFLAIVIGALVFMVLREEKRRVVVG